MQRKYSFIIPVFNRPDEVRELLDSFKKLEYSAGFEIVIIEDGSTITCKHIVTDHIDDLNIAYFFKPNSGPGDSRNFGMQKATGNYFIILDSDCIMPANYLKEVELSLISKYVDFFGGPDSGHESFSNLQKAINFVMTSFITTGGIRGNTKTLHKFQPRSFNMGISKKAFLESDGFGQIHPGEDPDLTLRLWELGYTSKLIEKAYVYHKRRISWSKFYKQVHKFGLVRPILNLWHPKSKKITFWFPTMYMIYSIIALILLILGYKGLFVLLVLYNSAVFVLGFYNTNSIIIACQIILALQIQFFGYGYGFIKSTLMLSLIKKPAESIFPYLFFKK
tara:strand:+ start:1765 stop:2769 length:1005 start_codon:yes stop_codon:yes gene_type:complete